MMLENPGEEIASAVIGIAFLGGIIGLCYIDLPTLLGKPENISFVERYAINFLGVVGLFLLVAFLCSIADDILN